MPLADYHASELYQIWLGQQRKKWTLAHEETQELNRNTFLNNKRRLRIVLSELKNTVLGQLHQLDDLLQSSHGDDDRLVHLFSTKVPVSTYDAVEEYVNSMIERAESNLLVPPDSVAMYSETTGTTGKSKRYAVNKSGFLAFQSQLDDQNYALFQLYPQLFDMQSKELLLYSKEPMKLAADGKLVGSISMYSYDVIKQHGNYLKQLLDTGDSAFLADSPYPPIWRLSSPAEAYDVLDHGHLEPYYIHILFGLKNSRHVCSITSLFVASILLLFNMIQMHWRELVHDIRTAQPDTVNSSVWRTVPRELCEKLIASLQPPDEELANMIENIMDQDELPIGWGKMLFPNLLITQSGSAGTMTHYTTKLASILGDCVHSLGENYSASEGFLGVQENYTATNRFQHGLRYGYAELLPEDQWFVKQPRCITIDEAQLGQRYELVITNLNGLYRYRMGDVIEYVVQDSEHKVAPVFQLCYRRGALLNHFGEKVTEQQLVQAIYEAIEELNSKNSDNHSRSLVDYCATSVNRDGAFYHTVFIELTPNYDEQKQEQVDWETFAATIDSGLCAKNKFYVEYREQASLQPLDVRLCQKNTFQALKRSQRTRGAHFEQFKVPRAIPAEAHALINMMMEHSIPIVHISLKLN